MMNSKQRVLFFLISLVLLLGNIPSSPVWGQLTGTPESVPDDIAARIDVILEQLSVEERVGQLFIVSFVGQNATPADAISDLIREYKIGGVVLLEVNNNVANDAEDTPGQVTELTRQLQTRAYESSAHTTSEGEFFLPLFVAIDHEGDGIPRNHLRNGFTPIPSAMALGATWSPSDVEAVGAVVGQELAAVGINMLLGPVVDVLEKPRPEGSGDINIRAMGGSPFWVGHLGRAYIRGVHEGGEGRVLTIAKHFPGHGASDRLPDDEVATVNKTLDELRQSDLVPFFAVTRHEAEDPLGISDGLMPSHIRYKGFQGDVNQLTSPISLDRDGMAAFMALSPLAEWREGGLVVCDSLGVPAVKGFYDPTFQTFPAKQIAKDALMAGNDVLPLVSFAPAANPGWFSGQLPTIQETITFFQDEYRANEVFRRRVDDAVRHILRAKLRLYPTLTIEEVLTTPGHTVGGREDLVAAVVRKGLTLLYPEPGDLSRRLPTPPRWDENILIAGCFEDCLAILRLQGEALRDELLDLYGPGGSGLIDPERVTLLNFARLYELMSGAPLAVENGEEAQAIIQKIQAADWILLFLINYMPDTYPQSGAARRFLRDPAVTVNGVTTRFDLRDKKIVALALHAPYTLDATEIAKLSAYYAVYSKVEPALEVVLRALFQEVVPSGAPPVSVEGIGYDLETALRPDPKQSIRLNLLGDSWRAGDAVQLLTDPVLDHNGHPIPDGTRIRFQGNYAELAIGGLSPSVITDTVAGVAGAVFRPQEAGRLEIVASNDGEELGSVSLLVNPLIAPTDTPSSPSATALVTPMAQPSATMRPSEIAAATSPSPTEPASPMTPTGIVAPAITVTPALTATPALSLTPTDIPDDGSLAAVPTLITMGAVLALGMLGFLWYKRRAVPPESLPSADQVAPAPDETATVSADLGDLSPTLLGRTLGSCRVDKKLGEGGMGQVYKGYHPMLDRTVAIKVLPPALIQSDEMRARFMQEARIAAALRHPNIVQIHDFGERDAMMYLIMEYVDGTSLKLKLDGLREAGETLPVEDAISIARQIAQALAYAHDHGAIHRDLKPANILLTSDGQAILVDFGLAVLRGGQRYTEPGRVWGSPTYIAPEQLSEPPQIDARSDIYSLGILLYEMVTGRPPFRGESVMETLWQQVNASPRPPSELAPNLPSEVEIVILKALAKDPNDRYATAREMSEGLQAGDRTVQDK